MQAKNSKFIPKNHLESQLNAFRGLTMIVKNEPNFRFHLIFAALVIIVGIILGFSHRDWVSVSLLIGLVLISEAFNSIVEALADSISREYRVNIRYAKDVGAGAVLISAFVSVIAGIIIVYPYLFRFVQTYLS